MNIIKSFTKYFESNTNHQHIVIGDSQTPLVAKNTKNFKTIGPASESSLWKGGMGLSWLKNAFDKGPIQDTNVKTVAICIGTNGSFKLTDDIQGLVNACKKRFPNAKLLAVKGSWGWSPYNQSVTEDKVNQYYDKFQKLGVTVMPTAIGKVEPHNPNLPVYKQIGKELDSSIGEGGNIKPTQTVGEPIHPPIEVL